MQKSTACWAGKVVLSSGLVVKIVMSKCGGLTTIERRPSDAERPDPGARWDGGGITDSNSTMKFRANPPIMVGWPSDFFDGWLEVYWHSTY